MAADKKAVLAILGGKPAAASPADADDTDEGPDVDLEAVAGDILAAIDGKDAGALAGALQSFLTIAGG